MDDNEIPCAICGEPVHTFGWSWGGEDAHEKCVLNAAEIICTRCKEYVSIFDCINSPCPECGGSFRMITDDDKKRLRGKQATKKELIDNIEGVTIYWLGMMHLAGGLAIVLPLLIPIFARGGV